MINNKTLPIFIGGLIGGILGIPGSYWFQSSYIRQKMSLGEYVKALFEAFAGKMELAEGMFSNIMISCVVCALVGGFVGFLVSYSKSNSK